MQDIARLSTGPSAPNSSVPSHPDLDQVFSRYMDPVYHFLYDRVGNREDAEDLTSEVFLKASRQLDTERPEASIALWLFTVARTVLADHWRRYYRAGGALPFDDRLREDSRARAENYPASTSTLRVQHLLQHLPERYRLVLELRFLRGYTIQETACEMRVTPENVKVMQHRALAKAVQVCEAQP